MLRFARQLPENNRIEILAAVELIINRLLAGEMFTSVAYPPRFGKSDIIRLCALETNAISQYPVIMLAPWEDNVVQIGDVRKIIDMYRRYGVQKGTAFLYHRCRQLRTNRWWTLTDSTPTMISATLGLVNNKANQQQFLDGIEDIYQRSGKRIPVFVDECHLVRDKKALGNLIARIVEAGGYVVLLTGTPVPGIPGFEQSYDEWEDVVRHIPRTEFVDGEKKHFLERWEGQRRRVSEISAHITVEWKRAFELNALSKVSAVWIDVDVFDNETGEPLGPLSELAAGDLSRRLRGIQESPALMSKMALAGVGRLLAKRRNPATRNARMMVMTGNDHHSNGDVSNKHAKEYKAELIEALRACGEDPRSFRIEIATGVDADGMPNKAAAKLINDFREGRIDILIVKCMGIVGLDVPECKVLVFGSTLREGPTSVQALSRPLTTWGRAVADLILPRDIKMVQLYERIISDNGGEYHETDLSLKDKIEVEPPDEQREWTYRDARIDAYGDERGNILSGDHEAVLHAIRNKYPDVGLSDFQIIISWKAGAYPLTDDDVEAERQAQRDQDASGVRNMDEGLDDLEGEFGPKAKGIINKYISYADRERWLKALTDLQALAKRMCGVSISVNDIDDAALLKRLKAALDEAEKQMFPHA